MAIPGINAVIDISHHNTITNWQSVVNDGVLAVVHKATEGRDYRDKEYHTRKNKAKTAGLLWGSYHFSSSANPLLQVENYLSYAQPAPDELICLDYEPSSSGTNMSYSQMVEFVELIQKEIGRYPLIYGGHLLREATKNVTNSVLSQCPLWYARYADSPFGVPALWGSWTLWQYTDGNIGQQPHKVKGIGNVDRDTFNGPNQQALKTAWPLS
ncbi:glycoside hydrolase family 25 protein [Rhizobium sp. CF142]|uniref:glycoside hydrolase family 25 protein n=1 Tax=Rhizobium sp. CF142 TaxID=1144314 RepID=UPI00026F01D4|nr:glycoside hydrolase family 25 protein [Rhizobium sp. CF142]EJJ31589.1 lysozyme M1 (1,4-beta-N-acetylmuramidase) [Rhizobium sp. CF142]